MDLKELRALLRLMEGNDIEELEVEEAGRRVRIRRRPFPGQSSPAPMTAAPQPKNTRAKVPMNSATCLFIAFPPGVVATGIAFGAG